MQRSVKIKNQPALWSYKKPVLKQTGPRPRLQLESKNTLWPVVIDLWDLSMQLEKLRQIRMLNFSLKVVLIIWQDKFRKKNISACEFTNFFSGLRLT